MITDRTIWSRLTSYTLELIEEGKTIDTAVSEISEINGLSPRDIITLYKKVRKVLA